jgi:peptidoglycan-associated lipoprotein
VNKKLLAVLVGGAIFLLLLGGCASKKKGSATTETPPVSMNEPPPPPPPPPDDMDVPEPPLELGLLTIYFDYDKYNLKADAKNALTANGKTLRENADVKVLIEGHCDERGTVEYNLALGEKRAMAARDYLVDLGVKADRIRTISYGEEHPVDPGHTEASWAKNRRADFVRTDQ